MKANANTKQYNKDINKVYVILSKTMDKKIQFLVKKIYQIQKKY
jgi:hypothetical protein